MPTIPIFDPQNNQSLQSTGSIAPATTNLATSTANLFLTEGRALAEKIEVQSSKAEAQMKAPIIATAYADGLRKISQGDFSGFSRMEQANGMTAGNPFLMKFAEGARTEATQIARNFLDDQLSNRRIQAEKDLQASRIKATSDLQSGIESRQSHHDYRMETDAWNRENEKLDQQDSIAQQRENQLAAAQGRQPSVLPKSPRRPPPNPNLFDINQNDIPLPTEGAANPVATTTGGGVQSTEQNIPTAPTEQPQAQTNAQPKFTVAGVDFIAPALAEKGVSLTSIKGPYGDVYKVNDTANEVQKAKVVALNKSIELAGKLEGADSGFAKWSADLLSRGYTIQLDTSSKDKITASAENPKAPKNEQKTYYTDALTIPADSNAKTPEINRPAGAIDAKQIPINPDVRKIWPDLSGAIKQAGVTVVPKEPEPKMSVTAQVQDLQNQVNKNPFLLDGARNILKNRGYDPELVQPPIKVIEKPQKEVQIDSILKQAGHNPEAKSDLEKIVASVKEGVTSILSNALDLDNSEAKARIQKGIDQYTKDLQSLPTDEVLKARSIAGEIQRLKDALSKLK